MISLLSNQADQLKMMSALVKILVNRSAGFSLYEVICITGRTTYEMMSSGMYWHVLVCTTQQYTCWKTINNTE